VTTVQDAGFLAERFERQRPRLRKVAYRVLGSAADAEDVVQEAWLRLDRTDSAGVENLDAWLTTVVARVALNVLRSRAVRREEPLDVFGAEPVVASSDGDPQEQALLADSVGLALLVVLDTLSPPERLAFVLHDMFSVPFGEIAAIVERSPEATRQLASRARRRVRAGASSASGDLARQREVVEAFLAATREGDFESLVALLAPDVALQVDRGRVPDAAASAIRGPRAVAERASSFRRAARSARFVLVNDRPGLIAVAGGRAVALLAFTFAGAKIARIDILADRSRLAELDLSGLSR
jgi:RNA polymerase sigma factor (sigma-70 family)